MDREKRKATMSDHENQVFKSLVSLLEEHICANSGFANLMEAVTFRDALKIAGRKTLPRIEAMMNEYLKDYDELKEKQ